nr:RHS repeat-associated core domain-containing protein [Epilithonimonas hungarica]
MKSSKVPFNYKFGGKGLQESGMYDFGARFYMPDIGRWGVIDPLAETSRRWSTYTYVYNNPLRFIDPDGR